MFVRGHAGRWVAGRVARDPAREGRLQGNAGQDRSQGCAWHRSTDAARLVPLGALQIATGAEVRALLGARKLLQTKNHDVEMSLRGVLRGFGLKVGPTTPRTFPNEGFEHIQSGFPGKARFRYSV